MSNLLGTNMGQIGQTGILVATDERAWPKWHRWNSEPLDGIQLVPWLPGVLWSGSGFAGQAGGGTFGAFFDDSSGYHSVWDVDLIAGGGQQAKMLIGTTRDSTGVPLANAKVSAYVTSTNQFVGSVTSDTGGYFALPTQYGGVAHYLVAFKAGSPDIAGTSDNNLIPA